MHHVVCNQDVWPKSWEVDVVYIWCDTSDVTYIDNKNHFARFYNIDTYWSPTRNHQEILYSIMSVRKYMSRVRNIFICAPQHHRVHGLDADKYNVTYVSNADILGDQYCPNFNSHSLELFTYKIPGLSDYFIQFNDDFFINAVTDISDFYNFHTKKIKYYYENILMLDKWVSSVTNVYIQQLVGENYCFWPMHGPRMFYKPHVDDIVTRYAVSAEYTKKAQFRTSQDFQLVHIYGYYLLANQKGEFIFVRNTTRFLFFTYFKALLSKLYTSWRLSFLKQIFFQFIYKQTLYHNKYFCKNHIYSLIHIGNNVNVNKQNIDFALKKRVKFVCLNDSYTTQDQEILSRIVKENYHYFYVQLLK